MSSWIGLHKLANAIFLIIHKPLSFKSLKYFDGGRSLKKPFSETWRKDVNLSIKSDKVRKKKH